MRMTELRFKGTAQFWKVKPEPYEVVLMDAPANPVYGPKKFYLGEF
jgi:hypothetical protein